MIEIHNIHKTFGDKKVLDGVSGVFETGKTNLLLGASGTGKSVLLKCIVGLVKPDIGSVTFDGTYFTNNKLDIRQEIRRKIGMLFQSSALFDSMTVQQNVEFPLKMLTPDMSKSERMDRVNFCLNRVGLEGANKKMPSELSGGMKKRVGIARAIAPNCTYLFCDEPNSGLDPLTSLKIDELIKEITEEYNITTIIVTHDMNSVIEIGDKIMFLYEGKKLWEGTRDQIMDTDIRELNEFIFANRLMRDAKKVEDEVHEEAREEQEQSKDSNGK
ncbi:ATP-binding cassette domain-containing protein [Pontibacter sp. BT310]|jgi:phospholipid/cholesterol/gamma-HCH transport system ATP-binding protein|uniref:ATP-binding cassette domain-containing protein n=1 Tax=Pontibacter populi TaxID=890055 RepID=A0ABS6XEU3_9BACT|nr:MULTISPECIES: ATP-binding cassette domain-containing protein [Pontibacter]MBJ6119658.1 ATP-binding cassette domain-containing protein [Pontibacter sp. BT310]MBR0572087.1 ATP-binding cassette domain-containing protein [Microvirga sp. STS03]MBW3366511.1 ATP-binding cassette domain-containing protein [Pontibacter populi]